MPTTKAAEPPKPAVDTPSQTQQDRDAAEDEAALDEALQETFPASDPIAPRHPHRATREPQN